MIDSLSARALHFVQLAISLLKSAMVICGKSVKLYFLTLEKMTKVFRVMLDKVTKVTK